MFIPQEGRPGIIGKIDKNRWEQPQAQTHTKKEEGHILHCLFSLQKDQYANKENEYACQQYRYRVRVKTIIGRIQNLLKHFLRPALSHQDHFA